MVASEELYFYVTNRLEGKQLKASTMYIEDYMPKARFVGEINRSVEYENGFA